LSIGGSGAVLSDVGTIGTILSPVAVVDRGTIIATISGTIVTERVSSRVVLEQNESLTAGFVGTFDMSSWDSVSLDIIVGTLFPSLSGSLQVSIMSVEPLSQLATSTIVSSYWLVNGQRQRITAPNALGETLAVSATIIGTVVGFSATAQRKT
jgi:hypothetical protein